jgi:Tripartite tricarboxylate transporter TctB family
MSAPAATPEPAAASPSGEAPIRPRSDLADGLGWLVLGLAILIGSITMDRLERQDVNPYTVPGLLPGLLGLVMMLLGSILALRSWRRGALREAALPVTPDQREQRRRIAIVIALCLGYGVVLVGHGLPFWLASTIYVTGSILILQRLSPEARTRRASLRAAVMALVIGLGAAVITQLVFQELFLVRLP